MRLFYPDCLMNMSGLGGEILSFLLLQNPAETMATELGASDNTGFFDYCVGVKNRY